MGKALTTKRHATSASAAAAFGPETSTANTAEFRLAWCFPKPEFVASPFSPNASAAIDSWNPRTTAPDCKKRKCQSCMGNQSAECGGWEILTVPVAHVVPSLPHELLRFLKRTQQKTAILSEQRDAHHQLAKGNAIVAHRVVRHGHELAKAPGDCFPNVVAVFWEWVMRGNGRVVSFCLCCLFV